MHKLTGVTVGITGLALLLGLGMTITPETTYASAYQATCSISGVPATLSVGSSVRPALTVTNTGEGNIAPHMISFVATTGGPTTYFKEKAIGKLLPGQSKTVKLNKYTVQPGTPTGPASVYSHSDLNFNGTKVFFECAQDFSVQ